MNPTDATTPTLALPPQPLLPINPLPQVPGYEVLELVGRGGMGRVYRARHIALGRVVALKVLAREPDENLLARFHEEARAVATLQHPNIAALFEAGTADGQPFFTQEFLEGGSLAQSFDHKPQEPKAAARVVETIARAIQHSHEHNILHRDLKPANILLTGDGVPKVTDFGLAKTVPAPGSRGETAPTAAGLTHTGEILGTPAYMPPEQASGAISSLGPPSDVYSIGAILYEALTGRPPFQAADVIRTILMVREMDPVSPRTLQPDVPRDLETICLKCLAKESHKRYHSAGELADDLRRFLNGEPILARPVSLWERSAKWARRKPWQAVAAGLALAMAAGVAVGFVVVAGKNREVREANDRLAATNVTLTAALRREEQANRELTAAKERVEAEKTRAERTLGLTLYSLDRYFFVFSDRLKQVPRAEKLRLEILSNARGTLDQLSTFQPDSPSLQQYRAEGYDRLGNIESQLGNLAAAEGDYTKARQLAVGLEGRFPEEIEYKRNRLLLTAKLAGLLRRRGDEGAADGVLESVLPELNRLLAAHPDSVSLLSLESVVRLQLFERELRHGRWDGAEARMREVCDLNRRLAKADKGNPARPLEVIDCDRRLSVMLLDVGRLDAANDTLAEAVRGVGALAEPLTLEGRKLRASVAATLGTFFQQRALHYPAFVTLAAAARDYGALAAEFPDSPLYVFLRADTLRYLAVAVAALGDESAAVRYLERSGELLGALVRDHPDDASYRRLHDAVTTLLKSVRPQPGPE